MSKSPYRVKPGAAVSLASIPTTSPKFDKKKAKERVLKLGASIAEHQDRLYAENAQSLLIVLQGMDTAGKDGIIRHVFSGVNPTGCVVTSFKVPNAEERAHNFLWRCGKAVPGCGHIGIFNRSHYEDVIIVRVHPEILAGQQLPAGLKGKGVWERRYRDIRGFEHTLADNGTKVLKFFLHISEEEQRQRLLARASDKSKFWKISPSDMKERPFWKQYRQATEQAIAATSTDWAPWHIIPADQKWLAREQVARITEHALRSMRIGTPSVSNKQRQEIKDMRKVLEAKKA